MHGLLAAAQPFLIVFLGALCPALTLLYARRDKNKDEKKTAGQQFVDNIVDDNKTLRGEIEKWRAKAESAEAEIESRDAFWAECDTSFPEIRKLIVVSGALQCLREHRKKRSKAEQTLKS